MSKVFYVTLHDWWNFGNDKLVMTKEMENSLLIKMFNLNLLQVCSMICFFKRFNNFSEFFRPFGNDQFDNVFIMTRAGEPANFLAALAPDFFTSGSGSWYFFSERLRLQGAKKIRLRLLTVG